MNDDEHYCSQCGRREHECKCDSPMSNAYGLPGDLDDALYKALTEILGVELAMPATEAVCQVLASRRDALRDIRIFGMDSHA